MAAIKETHVDVTSQSTYPTTPQLSIGFVPDFLKFANLSSTAIVHYSFDGATDNGYINPNLSPFDIWPSDRKGITDKVWLRRDSAGVDTVIVVVTGGTGS
ncbi:MAG TPA: hypothetical protein VLV86_02270 [Vicinamibacterales bacterium]|nr:hypothetical protein [Vicinamibacterales bacterium]